MPREKLSQALTTVDWNTNVDRFLKDVSSVEIIAKCNLRLALWAKQFEICDKGNPALSFVREMQTGGHYVAALASLALYKPAAAEMRTIFETALYYTYFRTHPSELSTLVRDSRFYVEKSALIEYHNRHTPEFKELQTLLGLVGESNQWYNEISGVVHGQIPGSWVVHRSLAEIAHVDQTLKVVAKSFSTAVQIVHNLFLCTVSREMWTDFSSTAKGKLLAGLSGDIKSALGLDGA